MVLAVLVFGFLVLPGVSSISGPTNVGPRDSAVIFAGTDEHLGLSATFNVIDSPPTVNDALRAYFYMEFGTELNDSPSPDRENVLTPDLGEVSPQSVEDVVQPEHMGVSILLVGPVADSLVDCVDKDVRINRNLGFTSLTSSEQNAVRSYFSLSEDRVIVSAADGESRPESVGDRAERTLYTRVHPTVYFPKTSGPLQITLDDGSEREFSSYFNYVRCDFEVGGFWSHDDGGSLYRHPKVVARSSTQLEVFATMLNSHVNLRGSANAELLYVSSADAETTASTTNVSSSSLVVDRIATPSVLEGFEARFTSSDESYRREWAIFIGGVGLSIIVSIVVETWRILIRSTAIGRDVSGEGVPPSSSSM